MKVKNIGEQEIKKSKNKCIIEDCNKQASFGLKDDKIATHCKSHKSEEMVDVVNKKCLECDKIPLYNFKGVKPGIYCNTHKKAEMVNVRHRYCIEKGCNTQASFSDQGKPPKYCFLHKKENMNMPYFNQCQEKDCTDRAYFNDPNKAGKKFCKKHKLDGMIAINLICNFKDCLISANYNYEGEKAIYCSNHRLDGMINVKDPHCKTPFCYIKVSKKYEGYCLRCFIYTFPNKHITLNYKTKEKWVADYILKEFPNFTWITDKKVADGCSKRRPDLLLDLGYQVLIVEIDENQHQSYDCSCENKRLMEISQDLSHRPLVFIRFNPDDYLDKDGKNITSCWGLNGKGIMSIKKSKQKEWETRICLLKEQIEYWSNPENKLEKTVEVINLFFDITK